jgi:hypothetical protein
LQSTILEKQNNLKGMLSFCSVYNSNAHLNVIKVLVEIMQHKIQEQQKAQAAQAVKA